MISLSNLSTIKILLILLINLFLDSRESFENVKYWVDQATENGNENLIMILVGNKCDLAD